MRMRQSLAEIEDAFVERAHEDRARAERLVRKAHAREQQRRAVRRNRHGSMRFLLLVLVLVATAVVVTIAMFQTLYYVMG